MGIWVSVVASVQPAAREEERATANNDPSNTDPPNAKFAPSTPQELIINSCFLHPGDISRYGSVYKAPYGMPLTRLEIYSCFLALNRMPHDQNATHIINEIVAIIEQNAHLKSIKLKQPFPRHEQDVQMLVVAMTKCRNLTDISLGCEHDEDDSMTPFDAAWTDLIQSNQSLEKLNLDFFDLTNHRQSMQNLRRALSEAALLRNLSLRHCNVTDDGFRSLILDLTDSSEKKDLDSFQFVCNSGLTPKSINAINTLLSSSSCPRCLDVVGGVTLFESIGSYDSFIFRDSLAMNQRLVELNLVFCGINDALAATLFCGLEENKTLKELELDFNNITREYGMELCLNSMPTINLLHLSMRGLKTQNMQVLDEWRCPGTPDQCMRIPTALYNNHKLLSFRLDCPSCEECCQVVFARNKVIQKVVAVETSGPAVWPYWIDRNAPRWKGNEVLHLSTIFGILLRNGPYFLEDRIDTHRKS